MADKPGTRQSPQEMKIDNKMEKKEAFEELMMSADEQKPTKSPLIEVEFKSTPLSTKTKETVTTDKRDKAKAEIPVTKEIKKKPEIDLKVTASAPKVKIEQESIKITTDEEAAKKASERKQEVLFPDVAKNAEFKEMKTLMNKLYVEINSGSYPKQMLLGTSAGLVTGMVSLRIGRTSALALGSGILLYDIAHHNGIVNKDWEAISKTLTKRTKALQEQPQTKKAMSLFSHFKAFAGKSRIFSVGFVGGFLMGMAT